MDAGIFAVGVFALFPLAVILLGVGVVIWYAVKKPGGGMFSRPGEIPIQRETIPSARRYSCSCQPTP